jgi:hypothetical protein
VADPILRRNFNVRSVKIMIVGPRRLKQCKQRAFWYEHFSLARNPVRLQPALPNVGANGRLTHLQIARGLFHSQQISGFNIHATILFSAGV